MIKGAIFDVDGVILDTMPLLSRCIELFLAQHGIKANPDCSELTRKMTFYQACEYMKETYGMEGTVDELMKTVGAFLDVEYVTLPPKEGVVEFIERLYNQGVRLVVASSNEERLLYRRFKEIGIDKYFSAVISASTLKTDKKHTLIYEEALKALDLPKEDVIVFEDALYAIETVKSMGIKTAGVFDAAENWAEICAATDLQITAWPATAGMFV